jgi:predicted N-formylglutamate amidohydrolase
MPPLLAPDEPAAFEVLNPTAAGPWVLTCDHASNRVPRALGTLGLTQSDLARHIGWDIGMAAVTRALAAHLDAWSILQNYSRLVIDCNREPGHPTSIPVISERTEIPANINLSPEAAAQRQRDIFHPYHAAIAAHLDKRAAAARPTLLVTLHSFTPVYDGAPRAMHAGVLYNRDTRLAHALLRGLRAEPNLIVGDNEPYAVTDDSDYGVNVHGADRGLPHVEIEIRQDLVADAAGQGAWAERLARLLPAAMEEIKGKKNVLF